MHDDQIKLKVDSPISWSSTEFLSQALLSHAWVVNSLGNSYWIWFIFRLWKTFVLPIMQWAWRQRLKADWTLCDNSSGSNDSMQIVAQYVSDLWPLNSQDFLISSLCTLLIMHLDARIQMFVNNLCFSVTMVRGLASVCASVCFLIIHSVVAFVGSGSIRAAIHKHIYTKNLHITTL